MQRVMSIWFPELPLDRRVRMGDPRVEGCFAVAREIKNARRLTHLSPTAKAHGLHAGMSVADARAIAPDLLTEDANVQRETLLLRALWRWADSLSPWVALDPPDGLFLNITGCAHLFGGEREMSDHAHAQLERMQIQSRIAICDTKRGAWGLARHHMGKQVIFPQGKTSEALSPLPIAALALAEQTTRDLHRAGLKTLGQLYSFKSAELARRFGLELPQELSRALGHEPDPVSPQRADAVYAARKTLPVPIMRTEDVEGILRQLGEHVCARLCKDQLGARRFDFTLRSVDTSDHLLSAGFAKPCFDAGLVVQQFARKIDALKLEFGADWFRLLAINTEPVKPRQIILGDHTARKQDDMLQAVSTLGNRLGFDRVLRFAPQASHIPEREFSHVEALQTAGTEWPLEHRQRPERIFTRPERLRTLEAGRPPNTFQWRKKTYHTAHALGPERLIPEWWLEGDKRARDYWITTTDTGLRLWLLTYPSSQPPEWFIAGRFA